MERTRWFAKQFDFTMAPGAFPSVLERLRGTPARLEEKLRSVQPGLLTAHKGGWSILEHAGHLIDLETLHEGRIDDYLAGLPVLRAADLTNKKTDEANHNATPVETILALFRKTREHFVQRLEAMDPEISATHPRLQKPMRVIDMALFVAEHDDHHLASITDLMRSR